MKKAVMIIASSNFRDEELLVPKDALEKAGVAVTIASDCLCKARGAKGALVQTDMVYSDINVDDFDAVVFIGGSGASRYWDDPEAHRICRQSLEKNKVLAAICIAPVTLARSGVLDGKEATVFSSEAAALSENNVKYQQKDVVVASGRIVTASGPQAAGKFAQEILRELQK